MGDGTSGFLRVRAKDHGSDMDPVENVSYVTAEATGSGGGWDMTPVMITDS